MEQAIIQKAKDWANNDYFAAQDRNEISDLLRNTSDNLQELTERFYRELEFGTGGLRAPMGMGLNRMNKYNVRKATQALALMIQKYFGHGTAVVSYDSRHNSKEFALEVASVFAANNIKTYVFSELTPTPMLSFAIRKLGASAGVMITASHNPPIYNGYKAFWNDGAQVVPPIDKEIIQTYNNLGDWKMVKYISIEEASKLRLFEWIKPEVNQAFLEVIEQKVIQDLNLCRENGHKLSIVYTALHGTGNIPCNEIAELIGFTKFNNIQAQALPDGNFSTVKSPNPEDPKAMKMAIEEMLQTGADIAFGTDPDCDRLGVVVNFDGKPYILNGNQIGVLMLYYVLKRKAELKTMPKKPLVIKSIVTTPLQNSIVKAFGGEIQDTLTGFKWMAGLLRQHELKNSQYDFIFASEESFGYMPHCESRDKDGVSSVALMAEVALYYKLKGMNLVSALDEIYQLYGYHLESLVSLNYEGISGSEKINRIMNYFRTYSGRNFLGDEITCKEDYDKQLRTNLLTGKESKIDLPKSNVLSFTFKSSNQLFLRPSGTEPKIKFYTMVKETEGTLSDKKRNAQQKIQMIENEIHRICEIT